LFVALRVPFSTAELFPNEVLEEHSQAKWVLELHVTLFFIGQVSELHLSEIQQALAAVRSPPIAMRLSSVSKVIEEDHYLRTLRIGVEPVVELQELQRRISQSLSFLQSPSFSQEAASAKEAYWRSRREDERNWKPHLTLVRFDEGEEVCWTSAFVEHHKDFQSPTWQADQFHLFESTKDRGYVAEQSYTLQ